MFGKRISLQELLLLSLLAIPLGGVVGAIDALFGRTLLVLTDFRTAHTTFLLPFLGFVGFAILWCYQSFGRDSQKGMTLIFAAAQGQTQAVPLRLVPMVIVSTWLTHLFGGSAGREGVAIQIGGTLADGVSRWLPLPDAKQKLLRIGMAAGFAGLFRTPLAATLFATEVVTVGVLETSLLLPAFLASCTASFTAGYLGLEKFSFHLQDLPPCSLPLLLKLLGLGVLFGLLGTVFTLSLNKTKQTLAQLLPHPLQRVFLVGTLVGFLSLLCGDGRYSGLGTNLIAMSLSEGCFAWDFLLKLGFTVLTLACGFQGGEVTPLFSIGASLGAVLSLLFGLPMAFTAGLGYAAVFGSASNTLLAPLLIGAEVFGMEALPYFFPVCLLSYLCNGNRSIYPQALQKQ